jgi:hypothetical protein
LDGNAPRLFPRLALPCLALLAANSASAADFYGLLRSRDLTPFGLLRLDMRPAHAVSIEPGSWALETEFGYQNTWAMSPEVEHYLVGLEPGGRRALGQPELDAIRALPGENYLIDVEVASLDVAVHYKFSEHISGYAIASGISYGGGFLDSTIEKFHHTFGFDTFGRPAAARNDINFIYDLKSRSIAQLGSSPTSGGFLDPTLGVRFSGINLGESWHFSFEGAAKLALDGRRTLLSTGRSDFGVQAAAQYRGVRHAFYANAAGVYFAGGDFPIRQQRQVIPTLIAGYEYALTARTNLNIQGYVSKSVYSHDETDLEDLLEDKYQITAGLRHRMNQFLVSFGVTENVQNINNTPDIGFQLGFAWLPKVRMQ